MFASSHTNAASIGLLVLRIGMGSFMAGHGWGKVQKLFGDDPIKFADPIGLGETTSLVMASMAEFGGALLVILGLATRFGALSVAFTMGVAAFIAHANDPWMMTGQGGAKEPALLFMTGFLALAFTGAGKFSLDTLIARMRAGGTRDAS